PALPQVPAGDAARLASDLHQILAMSDERVGADVVAAVVVDLRLDRQLHRRKVDLFILQLAVELQLQLVTFVPFLRQRQRFTVHLHLPRVDTPDKRLKTGAGIEKLARTAIEERAEREIQVRILDIAVETAGGGCREAGGKQRRTGQKCRN